ncbi:metallophosphoesterase [Motiliproteus sp. SC1-56]|uniref:metallophosphoesterase n=1 Tax=Motiliproteus sp. SC1-56 TaxID=2799565 RepID=UPI001A90A59B
MSFQGYDLIGDVHGSARTLERLLQQLGYSLVKGVYRHPRRQAVFIGDIVDRGPRIREALHLVRNMVLAGSAQMVIGNHEYNCLTYCTEVEVAGRHRYLRPHDPRHERQIRETLEQFAPYPQEWQDFLQWFRELPLYLETPLFRAVHACWDGAIIERLKREGVRDFSDDGFLRRSVERGTFEWQAADRLLRGTYLPLPNGEEMTSADGYRRRVFRTKFWADEPQTHADVVFQPDPLPAHLAGVPLGPAEKARLLHYGADQRPLFIGHYWREGEPAPITPNIACLDYSAVKYGKLVAYRMDGESRLQPEHFVAVEVEPGDGVQDGDTVY